MLSDHPHMIWKTHDPPECTDLVQTYTRYDVLKQLSTMTYNCIKVHFFPQLSTLPLNFAEEWPEWASKRLFPASHQLSPPPPEIKSRTQKEVATTSSAGPICASTASRIPVVVQGRGPSLQVQCGPDGASRGPNWICTCRWLDSARLKPN